MAETSTSAEMPGGNESGKKARNTKTLERDERRTFESFPHMWGIGLYCWRRQSGAVKAKRVRTGNDRVGSAYR